MHEGIHSWEHCCHVRVGDTVLGARKVMLVEEVSVFNFSHILCESGGKHVEVSKTRGWLLVVLVPHA